MGLAGFRRQSSKFESELALGNWMLRSQAPDFSLLWTAHHSLRIISAPNYLAFTRPGFPFSSFCNDFFSRARPPASLPFPFATVPASTFRDLVSLIQVFPSPFSAAQ